MTAPHYRVYRYHQPTDIIFVTYGEAYRAAMWRYGAAYEFEIVEVWKQA